MMAVRGSRPGEGASGSSGNTPLCREAVLYPYCRNRPTNSLAARCYDRTAGIAAGG